MQHLVAKVKPPRIVSGIWRLFNIRTKDQHYFSNGGLTVHLKTVEHYKECVEDTFQSIDIIRTKGDITVHGLK